MMESTIQGPVASTISDGVEESANEEPIVGGSSSEDISKKVPEESSSPIISTSSSNQQTYYDEEVASDVNPLCMEPSLKKNPSLDESALETKRSSMGNVKFSRQLSSPTKFKLRRINMTGIISVEEKNALSPPRTFTNSWSFGSPSADKGMDGVVGSDDEMEVNMDVLSSKEAKPITLPSAAEVASMEDKDAPSPPQTFKNCWSFGSKSRDKGTDGVVGTDDEMEVKADDLSSKEAKRSRLPSAESVEFNLDMIELAPSNDENDKAKSFVNEKDHDDRSFEQMTDLQTDSEDSDGKGDSKYMRHEGSAFRRRPRTNQDDIYIHESKQNPIHFIGWVFVLMISIIVVPTAVNLALNSKDDNLMPSSSPSQGLNQISPLQSYLPSLSPSFSSPTQSETPSQSYRPSLRPSPSPSRSPTISPSLSPSRTPTIAPSSTPSAQPSVKPSTSPSREPTEAPSISPTTSPPTSRPTKSFSPTILSCEVHRTDGCDDYSHPAGWMNDLRCSVSNAFLTCSIGSCFNIRPGDWPSWELFITNSEQTYFRIRHNGAQTGIMLQEQNALDGSWTTQRSYGVKPSASELVFGLPADHIPHAERLRIWVVSHDDYGMEVDRIPNQGSLALTGAGDFCS